jgi:hypothetical protein
MFAIDSLLFVKAAICSRVQNFPFSELSGCETRKRISSSSLRRCCATKKTTSCNIDPSARCPFLMCGILDGSMFATSNTCLLDEAVLGPLSPDKLRKLSYISL